MYYGPNYKTPEQLQTEYNQAMQSYQNMYNKINTQIQPQQMMSQTPNNTPNFDNNGGDYKYVTGYQDVETMATRLDGTATLAIDFNNGLMWSKKFVKGQHIIQAFQFAPLNNTAVVDNKTDVATKIPDNKTDEKIDNDDKLDKILKRLYNIELRLKKEAKDGFSTIKDAGIINNESETSNL